MLPQPLLYPSLRRVVAVVVDAGLRGLTQHGFEGDAGPRYAASGDEGPEALVQEGEAIIRVPNGKSRGCGVERYGVMLEDMYRCRHRPDFIAATKAVDRDVAFAARQAVHQHPQGPQGLEHQFDQQVGHCGRHQSGRTGGDDDVFRQRVDEGGEYRFAQADIENPDDRTIEIYQRAVRRETAFTGTLSSPSIRHRPAEDRVADRSPSAPRS